MKTFWRLRKKNHNSVAFDLKRVIPQLKNADSEVIEDQLHDTDLEFYYKEKVETPFWIRLTLPFAFVVMICLFIFMPVKYIITGYWGYKYEPLINWFRALGF